MCWKLLVELLVLDLMLRQAAGAIVCREGDRVQLSSMLTPQCDQLQILCFQESTQTERLVGTDISFDCTLSGTLTFTRQTGSDTSATPITSGGRISISGRTLTITDIQPEDEGLYRCSAGPSHEDLGCLTVSGVARFRICDSSYNFSYTNVPTSDNSCSQTLNATEGMNVPFDTRLLFGEQGDCHCIEEVTVLRVRKDRSNDVGTIVYSCDETRHNCNSTREFVVSRGSQKPYDFSLVLQSVEMSNSGMYFVEVEVKQPGLSSVRRFWKIFHLRIDPAPPTTTMMPEATTPQPTDMTIVNTDSDTSASDSPHPTVVSGGVGSNQDDVAGIAGGVVGALVAVVILVVLLLVTALIYWKYRRTYSVGKEPLHVAAQSPPKVFSVETTVSYRAGAGAPPPMGGCRDSVCVRTSVFLPTEHESVDELNI